MKRIGPLLRLGLSFAILWTLGMAPGTQPAMLPPEAQPFGDNVVSPFQSPYDEHVFTTISLEQGLSQSTVRCILQDAQGFLWIGTRDGLNRYDGYRFTVFRSDAQSPHSPAHDSINALWPARDGSLWIGTDGGGLEHFHPATEQFTHYRAVPGNPATLSSNTIHALHQTSPEALWVGAQNGLNRLDLITGAWRLYRPTDAGAAQTGRSNTITALATGPDESLWVGTTGGLLRFDPQAETFTRYSFPESSNASAVIRTLFRDQAGNLWVGTADGLYAFDEVKGQFTRYGQVTDEDSGLRSQNITAVGQDNTGTLWIGTDTGLHRLTFTDTAPSPSRANARFTHYDSDPRIPGSLSDRSITTLYVDRGGILWIGTNAGGLNKFNPQRPRFHHYRADPDGATPSLPDDIITAILEDRAGNIWIGTDNSGLSRLDRRSGQVVHFRHDPNDSTSLNHNRITALYEDHSGMIWVGAGNGGLARWDPGAERFFRYPIASRGAPATNLPNITVIQEDDEDVLWVGTAGNGFYPLHQHLAPLLELDLESLEPSPSLQRAAMVEAMLKDHTAAVFWIGTTAGLFKYDPLTGEAKVYTREAATPTRLSHNYIRALYQDASGILWIGTNAGLDRFDPRTETFTHYGEAEGLPSRVVLGILEDATGHLWLSTYRGLSRFNPQLEMFRNYDTGDGLQGLEFTRACFKSARGEMFFGGVNGFNAFFPDAIVDRQYQPAVVITDFQIFNQSAPMGEDALLTRPIAYTPSLRLSRRDLMITFELTALDFAASEENQYAYIMEPFDADWNYVGTRRYATYTSLPPGRYTFKARGTNSDGIWSNHIAQLEIIIPPPVWQRWWFILATATALFGGAAGGYRWRIKRMEAHTRELEALVTERTFEIERRRQVAEGLREILIILNSNRSLKESLDYIVGQAAQLMGASDALVFRYDAARLTPVIISGAPPLTGDLPGEDGLVQALVQGEPLVAPDVRAASHLGHSALLQPESHRAVLALPLSQSEGLYGGLVLRFTQARTFSKEDLVLAATFADQAALAVANDQLRAHAEEMAAANERSRLARDLHDAVTQTLFSACLIAESLPVIWKQDYAEGQALLYELHRLTRGALAEMRTLLLELRPTTLLETNLSELLRQLAAAAAGRMGIPVQVSIQGSAALPAEVHIALFRIAQEALNNVVKHARATEVRVDLHYDVADGVTAIASSKNVRLRISDNGRGFDSDAVSPHHLGLTIIRERAQAIGAVLHLESRSDSGTQVCITWIAESKGQGEEEEEEKGNTLHQEA